MIVTPFEKGWEIMFQRNHALVAAALAMEIKKEYRPRYWTEMLIAIAEHDDGQTDFSEKSHITETGRPRHYKMFGFDLDQASRVVSEARYKSQFTWLMVSMHAHALRAHLQQKPKELQDFLKRQKMVQRKLKRNLGLSDSACERYYRFLRWCDECSLILCETRLTKPGQKIEVGLLANCSRYIKKSYIGTITVSPWPFATNRFEVWSEVMRTEKHIFKSSEELKNTLLETVPIQNHWILQKEME